MSNNRRDANFRTKTWNCGRRLVDRVFCLQPDERSNASDMECALRPGWQRGVEPDSCDLRKGCHFAGYGVIGLMRLRALRLTFPRIRYISDIVLAVIATALIVSSDEFHQTLVPNRIGSSRDVLLDASGAVVMCLLAYRMTRRAKFGHGPQSVDLGCSAEQNLPS